MNEIRHDEAAGRYSLVIEGREAYLLYDRPQPGVTRITSTVVPDALGGRGLGKRLVARAVEDAIEVRGEKIASSCWFATALIEKNPDWSRRLA